MRLLKPFFRIALLRLRILNHQDVGIRFESPPGDGSTSEQWIEEIGFKWQLDLGAFDLPHVMKVAHEHLAIRVSLNDLDEVGAIQTSGVDARMTCVRRLVTDRRNNPFILR